MSKMNAHWRHGVRDEVNRILNIDLHRTVNERVMRSPERRKYRLAHKKCKSLEQGKALISEVKRIVKPKRGGLLERVLRRFGF